MTKHFLKENYERLFKTQLSESTDIFLGKEIPISKLKKFGKMKGKVFYLDGTKQGMLADIEGKNVVGFKITAGMRTDDDENFHTSLEDLADALKMKLSDDYGDYELS